MTAVFSLLTLLSSSTWIRAFVSSAVVSTVISETPGPRCPYCTKHLFVGIAIGIISVYALPRICAYLYANIKPKVYLYYKQYLESKDNRKRRYWFF